MNVCECSQDTTFTHLAKTLYAKLTQFLGGCCRGYYCEWCAKEHYFLLYYTSVSQVWSLLTLSRCPQPLKNALQRDRNKWVSEESDVLTSERSIFYAECELVIRPKPQHRRRHNYFVDFFVPTSRKSLALKVFHIFKTPQQNVCRTPSWFVKRRKPRDQYNKETMGIGMAHLSLDQYATNVQPSLTIKTQGLFRDSSKPNWKIRLYLKGTKKKFSLKRVTILKLRHSQDWMQFEKPRLSL